METMKMQFCEGHWQELQDAVKARGLWDFVCIGGEEATRRLNDVKKRRIIDITNFEPLTLSHNAMVTNFLDKNGGPINGCVACYLDNEILPSLGDKRPPGLENEQSLARYWMRKSVEDMACLLAHIHANGHWSPDHGLPWGSS